jgi:predicted nucleic acid-binding protein
MVIQSCLIDTNILLRISRKADPQHQLIDAALARLASTKCSFYYTQQNIAELWNVMTRPAFKNGFGLTIAEADREVRAIEAGMRLLPDNEDIYQEWRRIIAEYAVAGVQVHDARLAAAVKVHGVQCILTLNVADFGRYTGVKAIHPREITTQKV